MWGSTRSGGGRCGRDSRSQSRPRVVQSSAEDCDVERVIRGDTTVAARLHEDAACVIGGGACPALAAASARACGGLATLIRSVCRVSARRENRLTGHHAADTQDVSPCARLRCERDAAGLRGDSAVASHERPLDCRTASATGGTCWSGGASRPCRPCRTYGTSRHLAALEVAREQAEVLHLHCGDAVTRQLDRRITGSAERQKQRQAGNDHRGRRPEPLEHTHVFPLTVVGLGEFELRTLEKRSLEPCKGGRRRRRARSLRASGSAYLVGPNPLTRLNPPLTVRNLALSAPSVETKRASHPPPPEPRRRGLS